MVGGYTKEMKPNQVLPFLLAYPKLVQKEGRRCYVSTVSLTANSTAFFPVRENER